jgi:hypothetical protein
VADMIAQDFILDLAQRYRHRNRPVAWEFARRFQALLICVKAAFSVPAKLNSFRKETRS